MRNNRKNRNSRNKQNKAPIFTALVVSIALTTPAVSYATGSNLGSMLRVAMANASALVQKQFAEASAQIAHMTASIGTFSSTTVANIVNNTDTLLSSIKVATAQNAQSAQAITEVQTKASQKIATARQTIHMQDMLLKKTRAYGSNGQGFRACVTVAENKGLDQAQKQTNVMASAKETETLGATTPKSDLYANQINRLNIAEKEFCPVGSTNCTPNSLSGGNVNATLMFMPVEEGSKEQLARSMFRESVIGVDMQATSDPKLASSPQGQMNYFNSNRLTALISPSAYSLAYIDAQNTKNIERDGVKYSANELIDKTVGRYYGGEGSKEWQASMIVQEPRGLLVEATRLAGLSVWLNNHIYQQNLRKEANLASVLISTASPLQEQVLNQSNEIDARAIRSAVSMYD